MYFQYVTDDLTQLNSAVIRVFATKHPKDEPVNFEQIAQGQVLFYAHTVIKWGIKLGWWEKVANCKIHGHVNPLFRSSGDDGNPKINVSHNWWVWHINEEQRQVGKLTGENRLAEVESAIPADSIVCRMKNRGNMILSIQNLSDARI